MAVFKKHSQALRKTGNVSEFLQSLEGSLQRELGKASQKQDPKALDIDRENQLVVEKGLEKEKVPLFGKAEKIDKIPSNITTYKPEGRYIIEQAQDFEFSKGTKILLSFRGQYHGTKAEFSNIRAVVITPPTTTKKGTYVQVSFLVDQEVKIAEINKKVYFSANKKFYVKIK